MSHMVSSTPARKVIASSLGTAVATVSLWMLEEFGGLAIPAPVQAAAIVIVTFMVGYLVPPSAQDQVVSDEPALK